MKKRIFLYLTIILIIGSACYKLYLNKSKKNEEFNLINNSQLSIPVSVVLVKDEQIVEDFTINGVFEPLKDIIVMSETQGKVIDCYIKCGDYIAEGEPLAKVDSELVLYQLGIAEANYKKAESDLRKLGKISSEAISGQQLEEASLACTNAKNVYLTAKRQYDNTIIKASVSGIISERYFEKGSFLTIGAPVVNIIDVSKMKFNAKATSEELSRVKPNQKVKVYSRLGKRIYEGNVVQLAIKPDDSKKYLIQVEVLNRRDAPLISGIDGYAFFESKSAEFYNVIPRSCIIGSITDPSVFLIKNKVSKLTSIRIHSIKNNVVAIRDGISKNDSVVYSGQINLENNARISVVKIVQ